MPPKLRSWPEVLNWKSYFVLKLIGEHIKQGSGERISLSFYENWHSGLR